MKLILGIGNYGDIYQDTRHNSGFQVLDLLSEDLNIPISKHDFKAVYGKGKAFDEDIILFKPLTYVNLSGEALSLIMQYFKIDVEDLIIVVDDMDTNPGDVRLKLKGSSAGHNGLKNIIEHIKTESFKRVKIGIGRPPASNNPNRIPEWVLSSPKDIDVYTAWKDGISKGAEAIEYALKYSFDKAMTKYNAINYKVKTTITTTIDFKK